MEAAYLRGHAAFFSPRPPRLRSVTGGAFRGIVHPQPPKGGFTGSGEVYNLAAREYLGQKSTDGDSND